MDVARDTQPRPRRHKSAAVRRGQKRRAEGRAAQQWARALEALAGHRGGQRSVLGEALASALAAVSSRGREEVAAAPPRAAWPSSPPGTWNRPAEAQREAGEWAWFSSPGMPPTAGSGFRLSAPPFVPASGIHAADSLDLHEGEHAANEAPDADVLDGGASEDGAPDDVVGARGSFTFSLGPHGLPGTMQPGVRQHDTAHPGAGPPARICFQALGGGALEGVAPDDGDGAGESFTFSFGLHDLPGAMQLGVRQHDAAQTGATQRDGVQIEVAATPGATPSAEPVTQVVPDDVDDAGDGFTFSFGLRGLRDMRDDDGGPLDGGAPDNRVPDDVDDAGEGFTFSFGLRGLRDMRDDDGGPLDGGAPDNSVPDGVVAPDDGEHAANEAPDAGVLDAGASESGAPHDVDGAGESFTFSLGPHSLPGTMQPGVRQRDAAQPDATQNDEVQIVEAAIQCEGEPVDRSEICHACGGVVYGCVFWEFGAAYHFGCAPPGARETSSRWRFRAADSDDLHDQRDSAAPGLHAADSGDPHDQHDSGMTRQFRRSDLWPDDGWPSDGDGWSDNGCDEEDLDLCVCAALDFGQLSAAISPAMLQERLPEEERGQAAAATRLQAWQRGRAARTHVAAMRQERLLEEERWTRADDEWDDDDTDVDDAELQRRADVLAWFAARADARRGRI